MTNLPIFTEPILLAIPKNHPLAKKNDLKTADIVDLPLIMLVSNTPLRRTIDEAFESRKIPLSIGATTDDPATLRTLDDFPLSRTIYLSSSFTEGHPIAKMIAKTLKEFYLS